MAEQFGTDNGVQKSGWSLAWHGDGRDHSHPIIGVVRIGRAPENDIVLADNYVSRQHCLLTLDAAGQLVIQDLGSTQGVYVNDQRLVRPMTLRPNDIIRVAGTLFQVRYVPQAPPQPVPAMAPAGSRGAHGAAPVYGAGRQEHGGPGAPPAWLEQATGERWHLGEETLIGRKEGNDIRPADRYLSRYHALIRLINGQYVLSDLGSANGTFINDHALYAPHTLRPGERVRFAQSEFVFGGEDGVAAPMQPILQPAIEVHQTMHFRLHYARDASYARQLPMIGDRLEKVYSVISEFLAIQPQEVAAIDVYLSEWLEDSTQPGIPLPSGGYIAPGRLAIYEVYRADAPGENLERSVIQLLLVHIAGSNRPQPPMVIEGLRAHVFQRLGVGATPDQAQVALATAKEQGELPAIATVLASPTPMDEDIVHLAAASFLGYLVEVHGTGAFRQFLAQFDPASPDAAARAAYGRTLRQLERVWHRGLTAVSPGGILRFIKVSLTYLRPYWVKVAEMVFYLALSVAFYIGLARVQGILIDLALIPQDLRALATIMGIVIPAFLIVLATSLREVHLKAQITESVLRELRLRIFSSIQRLHPGFFQQVQSGDILSRMTSDLTTIELAFTYSLAEGLRMVLMLTLALVTIFLADWKLALLALLGTPLFFVLGRYLGPTAARASATKQRRLADVTTVIQENLGMQAVVKAFGLEGRVISDFTRTLNTLFRSALRLTFLGGLFAISTNAISSSVNLAVMGVGAWLVIEGNLSTGTLFAFLALVGQVIFPLQSISGIVQTLQQASGAMDRVQELINAEPAIKDSPDARPLAPLSQQVGFHDVTFGYSAADPILRGLEMAIPAGSSVALVGPSGCGKSTILSQFLRFYEPQSGCVTFDGVDLRDGTLGSLRAQLGVVLQDNVLFNTSIRENIRLGRPGATDAEVEAAAKAAEIHDLVLRLPQGYDTVVGERGSRLSGGQRQRVAIARAIIRNPTVLLLDEATSALDPQTESAINETLNRLAKGRTTVSVTHRLASVVNADQIYVFDQGKLVEQGTHDELVRRGGLYTRLWQEQHGAVASAEGPQLATEASRLQRVPLFATLSPDLLDTLARRLDTERYQPEEVIITQGEMGDRLYIIDRGQVDVLAADPAGGQRLLAILKQGEHFGEMALLYDMPRTATVRARTPVQLYSLNKADFQELLTRDPRLHEVLERTIAERQRTQPVRPVQPSGVG